MDESLQEIGRFSSLINPGVEIPQKVIDVHGITNEMVVNAPNFDQVWAFLFPLIQDCIIVGYNILKFDLKFLPEWAYETKDLLPICRDRYFDLPKHSLSFIASHLGLATQEHRTLSDCKLCVELLKLGH